MSALNGNTNATKWTESRTISYLERIERHALSDTVQTLSRALVKVRIYKGIWTYWKRRWEQHEDIMDRICYIEQIFMMKIEEAGLTKRWHAGMCLFMLRVNYGQRETAIPFEEKKKLSDELPPHLMSACHKAETADREAARRSAETEDETPPVETQEPEIKPQVPVTTPPVKHISHHSAPSAERPVSGVDPFPPYTKRPEDTPLKHIHRSG